MVVGGWRKEGRAEATENYPCFLRPLGQEGPWLLKKDMTLFSPAKLPGMP